MRRKVAKVEKEEEKKLEGAKEEKKGGRGG